MTQTSQDKNDDDFEKQKKSTITEGKNLENSCVNNSVKFTTFWTPKNLNRPKFELLLENVKLVKFVFSSVT